MLPMVETPTSVPEFPARRYRTPVRRAAAALVLAAAAVTAAGPVASADNPAANSIAPVPSSGCHAPATAPGSTTRSFAAAGKSGSYIQDVPPATGRPLPLVADLHGYLEPGLLEHEGSGLGAFGAAHGFATITPQLDEPGLPRWDFRPHSADITYLSDTLTHVESSLCIDLRRVYVTGLSMGAFTTSSLACQLSDRIAAVAPVAGLRDFPWCATTRPVPVVAFHGTADPLVAYGGGQGVNAHYLPGASDDPATGPGPTSIPANAAAWAHRNGCAARPEQHTVTADVTLTTYPCPADATVELYSIQGGGHTWPGNPSVVSPVPLVGTTTSSIDATRIMWDFFRAHPLTGRVPS